MSAARWSGWPPQPHQAGRHRLQFLGPDAPPAADPLPPAEVWSWHPPESAWRNTRGGTVWPVMLADGRFRYLGEAAAEAPAPVDAKPGKPLQLALF